MRSIMQDYKKFSLLCIVVVLLGCQSEQRVQRTTGEALGTTYSILYSDTTPNSVVLDSIDAVFLRMNQSMSSYWSNSIISKVNRDEKVQTDSDFRRVFKTAQIVWKETNGYFDPTVGALVNAYGFGPEKPLAHINATAIDSLLAITGFEKVTLSENGHIIKIKRNTFLDFNAIAKGYAVDALADMLLSLGYADFLVEVGGELFARGKHPVKKTSWRVAIDHPKQNVDRTYIATLSLHNKGLASSGNYRKFRTDADGNKYVHTINPKTGIPVKSEILSTSVLASSTMLADAYATALMAMPFAEGKSLINRLEDVEALWVLAVKDTVQVVTTEGFKVELQ